MLIRLLLVLGTNVCLFAFTQVLTLPPCSGQTLLDRNRPPLANRLAYTYSPARTAPKSTSLDLSHTAANTNRVQLAAIHGRSQGASEPAVFNVIKLGADPTGAKDSAPAFRLAAGNDRIILVAPGQYRFGSDVAVPSPYTAFGKPSVLLEGLANFRVVLDGATITLDPALAARGDSMFMIDRSSHFSVHGGIYRATVPPDVEVVSYALANDHHFTFNDLTLIGVWGGIGAAFNGNWLAHGFITNLKLYGVGQCVDFGQVHDITVAHVVAYGAGNSPGTPGQKCFSFINDALFNGLNFTGQSWPNINDGVKVINSYITSFESGFVPAAGSHFVFSGNRMDNNLGNPKAARAAFPVLLNYIATGQYSSVGFPVNNVLISDNFFTHNGNPSTHGSAILITNGSIMNSDVMHDITIVGNVFDNNDDTAINASSSKNLTHLVICNNIFHGIDQIYNIASRVAAIAAPISHKCPSD
jgi:hypothetical protein